MIMIHGGGTCPMRWLGVSWTAIKREVTGLISSSACVFFFHRSAAITGAKSCLSGASAKRQGHSLLREGLLHDQWSPTEVSERRSRSTATNDKHLMLRKLQLHNFRNMAFMLRKSAMGTQLLLQSSTRSGWPCTADKPECNLPSHAALLHIVWPVPHCVACSFTQVKGLQVQSTAWYHGLIPPFLPRRSGKVRGRQLDSFCCQTGSSCLPWLPSASANDCYYETIDIPPALLWTNE